LAHKSYAAPYRLTTDTGLDATMIHGFIRSLNARRKEFKPERIIVTWESHGTTSWRKKRYPLYKTGRQLNKQFISCQEDLKILLYLFGIEQYYSPENEADDVIGRLTCDSNAFGLGYPLLIFASDKDLMQLIGEHCHMYDGKKIITTKEVKDKFGIEPKDIPKFLAVVGDDVDNIKGIDGIGPKKAAKYINMEDKEDCPLRKYKDKIKFNEKLTKLNCDCELVEFKTNNVLLNQTIDSLLDKYKLKSIKEKLDEYKLMGN